MAGTKKIAFGYTKRSGTATSLKIETPGGTVTVTTGLTDARSGRERIRVDVEANGARFSGEDPWWFVRGDEGATGFAGWLERQPRRTEAQDKPGTKH